MNTSRRGNRYRGTNTNVIWEVIEESPVPDTDNTILVLRDIEDPTNVTHSFSAGFEKEPYILLATDVRFKESDETPVEQLSVGQVVNFPGLMLLVVLSEFGPNAGPKYAPYFAVTSTSQVMDEVTFEVTNIIGLSDLHGTEVLLEFRGENLNEVIPVARQHFKNYDRRIFAEEQ